jgi:predicted  nucleic acid-binding Zn-ribbon protein
VARDLESTLKQEAERRRLTVSHLIRNILEDTFQLVDDVVANVDEIVNDSVELARRVGRDARRMAGAVREAVAENGAASQRDSATATLLEHVYAWNAVVMNRAAVCAGCDSALPRGTHAFVGLSDDTDAPRTWLCAACREAL